MQKITTHFWFGKEAKEAVAFYTSLFQNSEIKNTVTITGTPAGDSEIISFSLSGQDFMAINTGPGFKFNSSISLYVACEGEEEIKALWNALIDGGVVLMAYDTYPWAKKYGWLQDKYGLSWQLSWIEEYETSQKIIPFLTFTKEVAGKAEEAVTYYTGIFPDSRTEVIVLYEKEDGDKEGLVKHSRFMLDGQQFMAMDSSLPHEFSFNEAISFVVTCKTQEDIDYYWEKLSAVPEAEQCGWLKDAYGVSWQIVPSALIEMMSSDDKEKVARVTHAFLKMKKFNIEELESAFEGE